MAEDKLDFSLPGKKPGSRAANVVAILLLLVLVGLTAAILLRGSSAVSPQPKATVLSAEQARQLATKLAGRNLYEQAAGMWEKYIARSGLTGTDRAKALFETGTLLEKAHRYGDAIEYFYRSEMAAKLPELESRINAHVKSCFEKSGRFSALRYELMDRTSLEGKGSAGGKVVAELGPEKITEADLDAMIEQNIDNQLEPYSAFMTAEQLASQKKKMLEQYKSPSSKQQFIEDRLGREVLYREALTQGLSDKPQVKRLLEELEREVLSRQIMNQQLADKIHITETDLRTYYEANKDKYTEEIKDPNDPNAPARKRQKSFDEAGQELMSSLANEKRQDVQQAYMKEMMDKYNVVIHTSALPADKQGKE